MENNFTLSERHSWHSTRNKYVQMVKATFRWAKKKGYVSTDPAADSDVLKRRKHAQRNRRFEPDEEAKLPSTPARTCSGS